MTRDNVTELIVFNRAKKKVTWAALATAVVGLDDSDDSLDDSPSATPCVCTNFVRVIDVTFDFVFH